MNYVVALIGLAIAGIGLVGVVKPRKLTGLVDRFWKGESSLYLAAGLRIAIGSILIIAAESTHFPLLITILGVASFLAGIGLLALGYERVNKVIRWFQARPPAVVRVSAIFAIAFGLLLLVAGI